MSTVFIEGLRRIDFGFKSAILHIGVYTPVKISMTVAKNRGGISKQEYRTYDSCKIQWNSISLQDF